MCLAYLILFVANFIEIDGVFFSPAMRTDGQTCSESEKNNILWRNTNKPYVFLGVFPTFTATYRNWDDFFVIRIQFRSIWVPSTPYYKQNGFFPVSEDFPTFSSKATITFYFKSIFREIWEQNFRNSRQVRRFRALLLFWNKKQTLSRSRWNNYLLVQTTIVFLIGLFES